MIDRSIARAPLMGLLGFVLAACSTTVSPTATPIAAASTPAPGPATFAPPPTPEPTPDFNKLPPTTTVGWWGDPDNPAECMVPGHYRIGNSVAPLGDCLGMFVEGPPSITLDVGEDFDLHMTIPGNGEQPIYPLPEAEDAIVARGWLIHDDATMTYRGLSSGTTRLVSDRACERRPESGSATLPPGDPCPVLVIHVRDIETECIDLAADVCRAAAATAISNLFADPGQRVVGWVTKSSPSENDWPGCGRPFAKVTIKLADPAAEYDISIGRLEVSANPYPYAICTF